MRPEILSSQEEDEMLADIDEKAYDNLEVGSGAAGAPRCSLNNRKLTELSPIRPLSAKKHEVNVSNLAVLNLALIKL